MNRFGVFWTSYSLSSMPPYFCDCVCPANNSFNKSAFFFIGFLGLGAVLLTSALRSIEPRQAPSGGAAADAAEVAAAAAQRRIKLLEDQVERAFNAVMAMIVLVLATVLTVLLSHGVPGSSDRTEL